MELRDDAKWALVVPTSMGIRITPENGQPVHTSDRFLMQATSAETNVASVVSYLGLPTKVLTNFVHGSPISAFIKQNLRSRGMAFEGPDIPQGDAWGLRHQFNIADSGYGLRGARVWNDRAGEVGRELDVADFDLDKLFVEDGVKVLHLSGLVAAISPKASAFCVELARKATENGTRVSMDMNYRASFWKGREEELGKAFHEIAELCDILIGNEEDFQLCLGIEGPPPGGEDIEDKIGGFKAMIGRLQDAYLEVVGELPRLDAGQLCDEASELKFDGTSRVGRGVDAHRGGGADSHADLRCGCGSHGTDEAPNLWSQSFNSSSISWCFLSLPG